VYILNLKATQAAVWHIIYENILTDPGAFSRMALWFEKRGHPFGWLLFFRQKRDISLYSQPYLQIVNGVYCFFSKEIIGFQGKPSRQQNK
jgi:hypothetical protein